MSMMTGVSYKTGFMFPGQGAQTVGMAGALCEELSEAKDLFTKVREQRILSLQRNYLHRIQSSICLTSLFPRHASSCCSSSLCSFYVRAG